MVLNLSELFIIQVMPGLLLCFVLRYDAYKKSQLLHLGETGLPPPRHLSKVRWEILLKSQLLHCIGSYQFVHFVIFLQLFPLLSDWILPGVINGHCICRSFQSCTACSFISCPIYFTAITNNGLPEGMCSDLKKKNCTIK